MFCTLTSGFDASLFFAAKICSQQSTAQKPSFSRQCELPVPKLSSPQMWILPASSRLPKNFQPVGVSKFSRPSYFVTLSRAPEVGMDLAAPAIPDAKYGMSL